MTDELPLLVGREDRDVVVYCGSATLGAGDLIARSAHLYGRLPQRRFFVNTCERRGTFLIALLAALRAGATTLLPANPSVGAIAVLADLHPDQATLDDASVAAQVGPAIGSRVDRVRLSGQPAVMVFTSGSTGVPQGHAKSWATLLAGAALTGERLFAQTGPCNLVTTVPSQHMFGLETGVLLTLGAGCSVSDERPFFPRDIAAALEAVPAPRVLVTTPTHLRACVTAGIRLPPLAFALSSTASLAADQAAAAEAFVDAPVIEIYGCTEAGAMATRRTIEGDRWHGLPGARFEPVDGGALYFSEHLPEPVALQDLIDAATDGSFRLLGRARDLVKVAGKRASLADLTQKLLAVEGVADAVIFMPSDDGRCAALVVAPLTSREQILAALARHIDPAFLPRPLKLVAKLPRNEAGKLPRAALLAAIDE
ncbi:MAG TPA: AMP-binding protein [Steroidobacteraceae bacterium]|nr:AMP-binding protein [Steroidobacteraceae bacterium]